ncbi:hypothetical protein PFLUV_G00095860 [Perca fluviatilis]|uniref:Uncharacterized protein n=1 Tax=Perca fluviatilis TaxID=8168 RepID=A0A6A5FAZ5_PERFL|nr:hypothetical protein PFLUV_G00095860 [Perca fluviatilis]
MAKTRKKGTLAAALRCPAVLSESETSGAFRPVTRRTTGSCISWQVPEVGAFCFKTPWLPLDSLHCPVSPTFEA